MGKPIIVDDMEHCLFCGSPYVEWHHVFFGHGNRDLSDEYGMIVPLCRNHHQGNNSVHRNRKLDLQVKQLGQTVFENKCGTREEFMKIFGRNYLD